MCISLYQRHTIRCFIFLFIVFLQGCAHTHQQVASPVYIDPTKSLFPLPPEEQRIDRWIPSDAPSFTQSVFTTAEQQARFKHLKGMYYGYTDQDKSPWNPLFIQQKFSNFRNDANQSLGQIEQYYLQKITSVDAQVFGENFRPVSTEWKLALQDNTDIDQFLVPQRYQMDNRAIMTARSDVRVLPSAQMIFEDTRLAGQGFPFDVLQNSSVAPGTPVYILGVSNDQAWYLVLAPEVLGWVKSAHVARTDAKFIQTWRTAADRQLGALVQNDVSFGDHQGQYRFTAGIGTILPIEHISEMDSVVYIPVKSEKGYAVISFARIPALTLQSMPWNATPENISQLMRIMIGRPYGWGGLFGYHDCSAELRSLMMPFGIFLPRNSLDQSRAGKRVDKSQDSVSARIRYLQRQGKPFRSLIYIGGHVMLYIGNGDYRGKTVPMIYQNIWGLRPEDNSRRSIIGQSVIFPLLEKYEEDVTLQSLADKKFFVVTDIGEMPENE